MKSLSSRLIYALALSLLLTACGNDKKTVGPSGPPPAAPADKADRKVTDQGEESPAPPEENAQGGPSGGLKNGPEEANGTAKSPKRPQGGDIPLDHDDKSASNGRDEDRPSKKTTKPKPAEIDVNKGDEIEVREITVTQRDSEELFEKKPRQRPVIQEKAPVEKKSVVFPVRDSAKLPVAQSRGNLPALGDTLIVRGQSKPAPVADFEAPEYDKNSPAYSWTHHMVKPFVEYLGQRAPSPKYLSRKIVVTFALGYYDVFHDKPLVYQGVNYGRHVNVDPWLRQMLERTLERPCVGAGNSQVCGFELQSTNGMEAVYEREGIDGTLHELHVVSAGETTSYEDNAYSTTQGEASRQAARIFAQSFANSDLVIYVGHSRGGGGPDFFLPRLNGAGHVDYASYRQRNDGERMVVNALRKGYRRATSLALMSCDSTDHFLGAIRKAAPGMQVATVSGTIDAEVLLSGGIGALDLYLRQASLKGLDSLVGSISRSLNRAVEVRNPR